MNKSLKAELTSNSELRITIMTLNGWLNKLKRSAQYLNLQTMLHKEKEKEALLLKEKVKRERNLAREESRRLQNIDKREWYISNWRSTFRSKTSQFYPFPTFRQRL